ncbi:hypothetical protein AB0H76_05345 [Nocardia sp. NPDC050712]|uniref:hypothetical protein n=1 Tax=Nocardia sp. NPDC050712 TaxID=3155518 RepID=UPI0034048F10
MSYHNPYKLFLPQHTPSKHRVVALYSSDGWDELKAIATFDNRWDAVRLADALNELLAGTGLAPEFVMEAVHSAPGPVRAEVERIAEKISSDVESDMNLFGKVHNKYLDALYRPSICGVMRFPVRSPIFDDSGSEIDRDTAADLDEDEYYFETIITPRTAEALRTAGVVAADEIKHPDLSYGLPPALEGQKPGFYKKLAQCFENLVDDLNRGDDPEPRSMGEEIALWLMLADAEEFPDSDMEPASIRDLPESEHDYSFDELREALYQDHDFRDLLHTGKKVMGLSLDEVFKPFRNPPPRQRRRPTATRN